MILDIDGVLNTERQHDHCVEAGMDYVDSFGYAFDPEAVANLERIVNETGADIVGAQIPMWDRAKDIVLEAAALIPQIGYVGWDVAVGENDVMLVEANQHPGHDFLQMPPHVPDKIGMLPRFREFIDI